MKLLKLGKFLLKDEKIKEIKFEDCENEKQYRVIVEFIGGDSLTYDFDNREDYDKHIKFFEKEGIKVVKEDL